MESSRSRVPGQRRARPVASVLLLAMLAAAGNLYGQGSAAGSMTPDQANGAWAGAACTLLTPIKIKGKGKGWVASRWIPVPGFFTVAPMTGTVGCASCAKGELPFSYSMMVSDLSALAGLMRGKAGTPVTLTLSRVGVEEPFQLTVVREEVHIASVPYYTLFPDKVGYIKLGQFQQNCSKEVRSALLELQESGSFDAYVGGWREPTLIDLEELWHSPEPGLPSMNYVGYSNPEVDRLIVEANEASDFTQQEPIFDRIQELIVADQPYTFLYESHRRSALSSSTSRRPPSSRRASTRSWRRRRV